MATGSNDRGYVGLPMSDHVEVCRPIPVAGNVLPTAFEADSILVTNVPYFVDEDDLVDSIRDRLPSTLTMYAEDGVTTLDWECNWDYRGGLKYDFATPEGLLRGHITAAWRGEEWPETDWWAPIAPANGPTIVVEAYPEELISIPDIDFITAYSLLSCH